MSYGSLIPRKVFSENYLFFHSKIDYLFLEKTLVDVILRGRNRESLRPGSESFLRSLGAAQRAQKREEKLVILRATSRDVSLSFHAGLNLLTSRLVNKLSPRVGWGEGGEKFGGSINRPVRTIDAFGRRDALFHVSPLINRRLIMVIDGYEDPLIRRRDYRA